MGTGADTESDITSAYVILSHSEPKQVLRLARAIVASSPGARVLIAHDARSTAPPVSDDHRIRVHQHGLATDWGSWELVEAALRSFALARSWADPDLVCLVSGGDYPAAPLQEWERQAVAMGGWTGLRRELRYAPRWGRRRGEGDDTLTRYDYRWLQTPAARAGIRSDGAVARLWRRVRDALMLRLEPAISTRTVERGRGVYYGFRRRRPRFTASHACYAGSQWIAITRDLLDPLLDEDFAPRASLRRLYRQTIIPDESALVTALSWRRPPSGLPPISHIAWDRDRDQPRVLDESDFSAVTESGSPFCRKVERGPSDGLMDMLDAATRHPGRDARSSPRPL
ncbi:hypothetical protein [Microbacterium thalassium]|uniref:Core-2/I-Branching enzyme n=1 Tax=Microbacterium thalassium TaxID=362649 RepID=A0A7X0FLV1_9MICO|nr:hypothetical protein [Microbacterium thalassium]MBB6389892.1 hypothetical protein [Microbacterium thalassium]